MPHALLGIAIALIVAIAGALAAPAVVDWNDWRSTFERHATDLAGAPVRIGGNIEATILPTPAFVFRDVQIGDPEASTGVRAGEARGILSLGSLLRGRIEAEEFVLVRPQMRLAFEHGGRIVLPPGAAPAIGLDLVSFSAIAVERGSLVIEDRANQNLLIFDEIFATGEMQSRFGPMRLEANMHRNGRRWTVRANATRFDEAGQGRVRMTMERPDDGIVFDADGGLALGGFSPRFEGKVSLARSGAGGMPWRLAAHTRANEEIVALESLEVTLGAEQAPVQLAGHVQFAPRQGGGIEGTLSARTLDLDLAAATMEGGQGVAGAFAPLRDLLGRIGALPFVGRIGLAVDGLAAGGGTMRDVLADLGLREGRVAVERLEARLPGRGTIHATGQATEETLFAGQVKIDAEDSSAFLRWALGPETAAAIKERGALRAAGRVEWGEPQIRLQSLQLAIGSIGLGGQVSIEPGAGPRRARIGASLIAEGIDLDIVAPTARALWSGSEATDLTLKLEGRELLWLGRPLRRLDVSLSRANTGVAVEEIAVENFDGLSGKISGRIEGRGEKSSGQFEFELEAARSEGLAALVEYWAGSDAERVAEFAADQALPLRASGAASLGQPGLAIAGEGRLAEMRAKFSARLAAKDFAFAEARAEIESEKAERLVMLLGLPAGAPAGKSRLEVSAGASADGVLPVRLSLATPEGGLRAEGSLGRSEEGRLEPKLAFTIDTKDARPLLGPLARISADAVPANGGARLVRAADHFAFEDIALHLGGDAVEGRFTITGREKPAIGGKLSFASMELPALLAAVVGRSAGEEFWPAGVFSSPALAGATGVLDLGAVRLGLAGARTATDAGLRLKLGPNSVAIEDFSAQFAGGRLAGDARFVRGERIAFDGRVTASGFDLARAIAPDGAAAVRGRGDLSLSLSGSGNSPAALAASLSGQGTLAVEPLEIDSADPAAIAQVYAATAGGTPPDEVGIIALLAPAFAQAPLRLDRIEAPLVAVNGVVRTGKARVKRGDVQIVGDGSLDLARRTIEASLEFEAQVEGATAQPAATVRWRGPVAAPERGIEAAALATAITLRAMERETRELEERDRRAPVPAPAPIATPEQERVDPEDPPVASVPRAAAPARPQPSPQQPAPQRRQSERAPPQNPNPYGLPTLPPPIDIRPAPGARPYPF